MNTSDAFLLGIYFALDYLENNEEYNYFTHISEAKLEIMKAICEVKS